jgi:serine/threonine-protein kinase RsbW
MLTGAAEFTGCRGERLDDLRTAVSEACSNVVLHAYGQRTGPLRVDVALAAQSIGVTVTDHGSGIRALGGGQDRMRVGLALISALADRAEFAGVPGGGTEVRLAFSLSGHDLAPGAARWVVPHVEAFGGDVVAHLSSAALLGAVLGRVCGALAARAGFTLDRHSDLDLVSDALAAHVRQVNQDEEVGFSIVVFARWLELTIGPLPVGDEALALPAGLDHLAVVRRLADVVTLERRNSHATLHVVMFDPRAGGAPPAADALSPTR